MLRVILFSLFILSSSLTFVGCSSNDKKADAPETAFELAAEYDRDERYDEAIKRYQEVKNKFPYSKFSVMAELAIADAYFKQESFAEAQVAYQSFKDLHPKHAQIDYVTFRLGMSLFSQLPPTIDRDLTLAGSAILYFDEVVAYYSKSEYVEQAKEKKATTVKMLADKENYIAEFYFIREKFDSALTRYEGLLKKYPGQGLDSKALSRAYVCAIKLGEPDRAKGFLAELESKFPNSEDLQFARKKGVE